MKTDEELVIEFKRGNPTAFTLLVERYTPILCSYLNASSDNKDLAQETFKKVFTGLNSFNVERPFKAWLLSIARNCSIDASRKAGRRFPHLQSEKYPEITDCNAACPSSSLSKEENKVIVKKAIEQLPEKQRQVLILSYYQNLSYPQIAKKINCSTSTVKTHMARALQKLIVLLPEGASLL